jgi:hypothetical protein
VRACPTHLCDLLVTCDARLWCPADHESSHRWLLVDDDTDTAVALVLGGVVAIELLGLPVARLVPDPYVLPPMVTCGNEVCGRPILARRGRVYCDHNCHPTSRAPRTSPRTYRVGRHGHHRSGAQLPALRRAS